MKWFCPKGHILKKVPNERVSDWTEKGLTKTYKDFFEEEKVNGYECRKCYDYFLEFPDGMTYKYNSVKRRWERLKSSLRQLSWCIS